MQWKDPPCLFPACCTTTAQTCPMQCPAAAAGARTQPAQAECCKRTVSAQETEPTPCSAPHSNDCSICHAAPCIQARSEGQPTWHWRACCRSEPNAAATENAVAALGRVLAYSAGTLPDQGAQLAELWLHALPLTEDKQEAEGQHALLVDFLDRSDVRWGPWSLLNLVPMLVLSMAVGLRRAQPDVAVR